MKNAEQILEKCKKEIICKYVGSDNYNLKHTDFLKLSDEIFKESNISISLSTLRRFFNNDFSGSPQISTLDAFAKYLGFSNWNAYLKENASGNINFTINNKKKINRNAIVWPIITAMTIGMLYVIYTSYFKAEPNYDSIKFSYKPFIEDEMPVTVYFKYDLKGVKCDSATIQPLGRPSFKRGDEFVIDPLDSIASYTYTWPNTFIAKLAVDGQVVKELPIKLVTNKWKAAISNTKDFYYVKFFDDKNVYSNGKLAFTEDILKSNNFPKSDAERTAYYLFRNFETIYGDSLCFATRIKNIPLERVEKAGALNVGLFFNTGKIATNMAINKSIYTPLGLKIFEKNISSKSTDLSFLYTNLEEWNTIKIITYDKTYKLAVNDSLVFETLFETNPGKLRGIAFNFIGMGEVDYVRFYDPAGEMIYNDEFE